MAIRRPAGVWPGTAACAGRDPPARPGRPPRGVTL